METGRELIARIEKRLINEVSGYEARVIAEHVTGDTYTDLLVGSCELNERQNESLYRIVDERNSGKPLAYVLKSITFRDLDLYVDERVLIPRSETEIVVQHAVDILSTDASEKIVIDMCTGSGAIALSIVHEIAGAYVYAADISPEALDVARLNGVATGSPARRVEYFCGDLFDPLPESIAGTVDLIVSNPPYIGENEKPDLDASVLDHEPHIALFAGEKGTDVYARIISEAQAWLKVSGVLILEISPNTRKFVEEFAKQNGYANVEISQDLAGRDRVAVLTK